MAVWGVGTRQAVRYTPMPNEPEIVAAIERREQREVRQTLRALFVRAVGELADVGWTSGGEGVCAECACPRTSR